MERTFRPTYRARRWLAHINCHGPQSSVYLHTLTSDTHKSMDTTRRQLLRLREHGYLHLPMQQRQTYKAEFNPLIYDITAKGKDHLTSYGYATSTLRPTGHWWHRYLVSCMTSALDMQAVRAGIGYISGHTILERIGNPLAIPVRGSKLIPDQLFALDYGGSFRAFALEIDRGTEPKTSPQKRKSWLRSLVLYDEVIRTGLAAQHYSLTAPLLLLWVFTSASKEERFWALVQDRVPALASRLLTVTVAGEPEYLTRTVPNLFSMPWRRDGEKVVLSR